MKGIDNSNIQYIERKCFINENEFIIERQIIKNNVIIAVQTILERDNRQFCTIKVNERKTSLEVGKDNTELGIAISKIYLYKTLVIYFYKENLKSSEVFKLDSKNLKPEVQRKNLYELNFSKDEILDVKYCYKGLFSFPIINTIDSRYITLIYNPENDSITKPSIFEYKEVEKEFIDPYEEQKGMQRKMIFRDKNLKQYF